MPIVATTGYAHSKAQLPGTQPAFAVYIPEEA